MRLNIAPAKFTGRSLESMRIKALITNIKTGVHDKVC